MLGFVLEEYMIVIIHVVLITPIRFVNGRFMVKVVVVKASGFVLMVTLSSKVYGFPWSCEETLVRQRIIIIILINPTFNLCCLTVYIVAL